MRRVLEKEKKSIFKNIKENKILKVIWNIIYTFMYLIVLAILLVVVVQRVSKNSVAIGGYRLFTVASGSMVPEYEIADILLSKSVEPSELKVGDDIVYQGEVSSFAGKIVTHRIISIDQNEDGTYKIITQGIANSDHDPEITDSQVYGKIVYQFKILSYIGKLTQNMYVFYFLVFIPLGVIVFSWIRNFELNKKD